MPPLSSAAMSQGSPTVTLTPAAALRFIAIISAEPEVQETDAYKLVPYAAFTVDGTDYGWYATISASKRRRAIARNG